MTFRKAFIIAKLNSIREYLIEIEKLLQSSDAAILRDFLKYHTAERLLQLVVDAMLDINQYFIRERDLPIAEDFQSTFAILGEHRILPAAFAQKIAPVVGLRNSLVHGYEKVNRARFVKDLRRNSADFKRYIALIRKVLR